MRELKEEVEEKTKAYSDLDTKQKAWEMEKYGTVCPFVAAFHVYFSSYSKHYS